MTEMVSEWHSGVHEWGSGRPRIYPPTTLRAEGTPISVQHMIFGGRGGLCQRTRTGSPERILDFGVCQSDVV